MILSEKYKSAMDKVTLSDERRAKIMAAASEKIAKNGKDGKQHNSKLVYIRCASAVAACLAIFAAGTSVKENLNSNVIPPPNEIVSTENPGADLPKDTQTKVTTPNPAVETAPDAPKTSSPLNRGALGTVNPEGNPSETVTGGNETVGETVTEPTNGETVPPTDSATEPPLGGPMPDDELASGGAVLAPGVEENADIDSIRREVGYDFALPDYMPSGYEFDSASLLFGELVQIVYTDGENKIMYCIEDCDEDISGDYNIYETVETVDMGGIAVTVRENGGKCYSAVWHDGKAHALWLDEGFDRDEIEKIVCSIK